MKVLEVNKKERVKELVEILERAIAELEEIAPPSYQAGELVIENNTTPGGYYLTVSRTTDGYIAIDEGEYGRWHKTTKVMLS